MSGMHEPLHLSTATELQERLRLDRAGDPYLVFRDGEGDQHAIVLDRGVERLVIGRSADADIALVWDRRVSRMHACLERAIDGWSLIDDGRARNGTTVNGERIRGRRRLEDHDKISVGATELLFRDGAVVSDDATVKAETPSASVPVTEAQRRVLVALCRPVAAGRRFAAPATNQDIADELVLSVDAIKTHLRTLFARFGLEDAPRGRKRALLVEKAMLSGTVSSRDYADA